MTTASSCSGCGKDLRLIVHKVDENGKRWCLVFAVRRNGHKIAFLYKPYRLLHQSRVFSPKFHFSHVKGGISHD
jgi:hypothetical protein